MNPCAVVPFPLSRRRAMIDRQARYASALSAEAAERHIQQQLKVQEDAMRRKGIKQDLVERELRCMETTIRSLLLLAASVTHDGATEGWSGRPSHEQSC